MTHYTSECKIFEKEEDFLVDILGLLGYKKEPLETVEDIDNLLKEFGSPRKRVGFRIDI